MHVTHGQEMIGNITYILNPSKSTSSSGAISVYDSTFYFMTTANRVYKVLYNGDPVQTGASNISGSERMRITSGGDLLVGGHAAVINAP